MSRFIHVQGSSWLIHVGELAPIYRLESISRKQQVQGPEVTWC
jgi:hypothetical protein